MYLFLSLYAGDTLLLAESPEKMQAMLIEFENYCNLWKLMVNPNKTKVMICFSKSKGRRNPNFIFFDNVLKVVDECTNLGLTFKYTGYFF